VALDKGEPESTCFREHCRVQLRAIVRGHWLCECGLNSPQVAYARRTS
jgi:hypothetical protein